ncbi:MAG: aminoacyl-tRNA hydrolase [Kiritimatiellae bacterium]|nr:aminoacyl-tRNA hydrolase [Kiritimatiellia bacterium]
MKVVVGLGNPGRRYERTRHNVGFLVADELARRSGAAFRRSWRMPLRSCSVRIGEQDVLLVKPETFMNRSGAAVAPLLRKKGLAEADLILVLDDADLPAGQLRVRPRGGAGGHNGLKSVIVQLGSEAIARVRVGIGRRPGEDMVDHVLSTFTPEEREAIEAAVPRAADAVESVLRNGVEKTMNDFN